MFTNYLAGIFVFIFGLAIGSFLNCVVYRIEEGKSFLKGRSFCPHCKHQLSWRDLFPVFSFLFLGGKCRYCKAKISWQYPAVEMATALIFLLILNRFSIFQFVNLIFWFYAASVLIIIFIYDLKHYLIPDKVLFPAIGISFAYRLFEGYAPVLNYLVAVLMGAGFFFAIWLVSKGKWMGFGDVKLAVLMGFLLGYPNILAALFLAFFLGAIIGVGLMIFGAKSGSAKGGGWRMKSEIPFGPFLIIGTFMALFYGESLIQWYLNLIVF